MKTKRDKSNLNLSLSLTAVLLVWILAFLITGCSPQSPGITSSPDNTPLPSPTPLRPGSTLTQIPSPTLTPTLELINSDLKYTVVGYPLDEPLPMYQQPSLSATVFGVIPYGGSSIRTTGIEVQADNLAWLQVEYQGLAGWVDQAFLARHQGDLPMQLIGLAQRVAFALKIADYNSLEANIHPELCLRFSPYPYIHTDGLVFCPEELAALPGSSTLYYWGQYDGSGDPIELSFDEYHQRFVYDQDFFDPLIVGLNQEVSSGNAINNIPTIFPDGIFVEYHFPGFDPQYGGMDWRSLRMVFMETNGTWYLVALVHCEWTI